MKRNRQIFSILLILVMVIQLTSVPALASTRTISRTSTKVTTSYSTRKLKLTKKASKTYSVVGSSATYITYKTQGNTSIKTTKKITPTFKYKKNSIYCTEKNKIVTTVETTVKIVQATNDSKNTPVINIKPDSNTNTKKKQIPLSSYARSKVGPTVANAFDTLGFKIFIDPSVNYSGYYSTKDRSITLRKNDNVLYHELGHFVSFISGCSCSSAEFKQIYNKEKSKYTKFNKAYVCHSADEFYAECYYLYLFDKSWLKKHLPQTYQYIEKTLAKITPDRIARIYKTYSIIWK